MPTNPTQIDLTSEIARLESLLAELKTVQSAQEVEPVDPLKNPNWLEYYHIHSDGDVEQVIYHVDPNIWFQGNAFATREEAETESRVREIVTKLRRLAGKGTVMHGEKVYSVLVDDYYARVGKHVQSVLCGLFFDSEQSAQHAIDVIGKDDLLFLAKNW